jgi:hypothetical protein
VHNSDSLKLVIPPAIPELLLYGKEVGLIVKGGNTNESYNINNTQTEHQEITEQKSSEESRLLSQPIQLSLKLF